MTAFPLGKNSRYPFTGRLDEPQRQSGRSEENILLLTGFKPQTVVPIT